MTTNIRNICKNNRGVQQHLATHLELSNATVYLTTTSAKQTVQTKKKYLKALIQLGYIKEGDFTFLTLFEDGE